MVSFIEVFLLAAIFGVLYAMLQLASRWRARTLCLWFRSLRRRQRPLHGHWSMLLLKFLFCNIADA